MADCLMKLSIKNCLLVDLDSIHNKLSSNYSLSIYCLRHFPCTDGQLFTCLFFQFFPTTKVSDLFVVDFDLSLPMGGKFF